MRYCINCGQELTEGAKFCSNCGTSLEKVETTAMQDEKNVMPPPIKEAKKVEDPLKTERKQSTYSERKQEFAGKIIKCPSCGAELQSFTAFDNRMGRQVNRCFEAAHITPRAYITTTYTQIATTICFQRLAACFCPQMSLATLRGEIPPDINIFPLWYKDQPLTQRLSLIRLKDRYLPHYSKFFLDLIFHYFSEIERIDMEHIV